MPKRGNFKGPNRTWNNSNRFSGNKYDGKYSRFFHSSSICVRPFWISLFVVVVVAVITYRPFEENYKSPKFLRKFILPLAEHDDRERRTGGDMTIRKDSSRRVSFKPQSRQKKFGQNVELAYMASMDQDEVMIRRDRRKRLGSPGPQSTRSRPKGLVESASGWFQVTVRQTSIARNRRISFFFSRYQSINRYRSVRNTIKTSC